MRPAPVEADPYSTGDGEARADGPAHDDGQELLSPSGLPSPAPAPPLTRCGLTHTTLITLMAFLANLICYADRTNLSVAIIVIAPM